MLVFDKAPPYKLRVLLVLALADLLILVVAEIEVLALRVSDKEEPPPISESLEPVFESFVPVPEVLEP